MMTLGEIDIRNKYVLELALAMLYLGEGTKRADETSMGNTDPAVLKTFIWILKNIYNADVTKFRCELYLRADQNPSNMKKFWATELGVPIENFKYVHLDKRTRGSRTYSYYKGVCMVRYGNAAIKRKLLNISKGFCEKLIFQRP